MTRRQTKTYLIIFLIVQLNYLLGQQADNKFFGTYQYYVDDRHDWYRLTISKDSTFSFENRTLWLYDSTRFTISYTKGLWRKTKNYFLFYKCDNDSFPIENTKWKYRIKYIYNYKIITCKLKLMG